MPDYTGKVAVITGAASGIGYGIASRAAAEQMEVVLVDVEAGALGRAAASLRAAGGRVHAMQADVADRASVMGLAKRVRDEVGDTWLLVNNAGVVSLAPFLEMTHEQWEFVVGVNLWGVVHGLQAFLPGMVERDQGHVVNTASVAGLVVAPGAANYSATKHAVVGLSETVYRELRAAGSNVGVSLLCPAAVDTDILRAERNWPAHLGPAPKARHVADGEVQGLKQPDEVAAEVFQAIGERRFWLLTHAEQFADALRGRAEAMITGRNPDDSSVDPNFRSAHGSLEPD